MKKEKRESGDRKESCYCKFAGFSKTKTHMSTQ